jgi:hypothetical protein
VWNFHLPIKGEPAASMGSNCEKYTSNIEITIHAKPFSNSFSTAAVGGIQNATNVMTTTANAGVTTVALNIGDLRWMTKSKAIDKAKVNYQLIEVSFINMQTKAVYLCQHRAQRNTDNT